MRLHIGKNHEEGTAPVQSIFRLAGRDEDALTYALGYSLAHDREFCVQLVRLLGVTPRHTLKTDYRVYLQEVTDRGFGRRDIVIEDGEARIVIEAKIGGAEPTPDQLLKYAKDKEAWSGYKRKGLVALTQVELSSATTDKMLAKLPEGILFSNVQWHQVVDLALRYKPSGGSEVSRFLFEEFIRYIRSDYHMGYYDAEILIQDVNPLNAEIFKTGWMYVTNLIDKKAPLYFAPYFTKQGQGSGISWFSRVLHTEVVTLAENKAFGGKPPSDEHRQKWNKGLADLRERAKDENFDSKDVRLFYLDKPISIPTPITKKDFKAAKPTSSIPSQIPKGFSLGFDELLGFVGAGEKAAT